MIGCPSLSGMVGRKVTKIAAGTNLAKSSSPRVRLPGGAVTCREIEELYAVGGAARVTFGLLGRYARLVGAIKPEETVTSRAPCY